MNFSFQSADATKQKADVLIIPVFETDLTDKKAPHKTWIKIDKLVKGNLVKNALAEGFKGKADQTFVFTPSGKLPPSRIIAVGLGTRTKFTPEVLRLAAGRAVKTAFKFKAKSALVQLPGLREFAEGFRAIIEGMELGAYRYDKWKTQNKEEKASPRLERVQLVLPEGLKKEKHFDDLAKLSKSVAEAANWARDLVNEPAETMTPTILADEAKKMAKEAGLNIFVGDKKKIQELKMGMFLGVTKGSVEEPRLVQISYVPTDVEAAKLPPVCIVGKAITFDSGGHSLKPSEGMMDMKVDMAGSAAMLGAMKVIAAMKPPFPVYGFFGACENMLSGSAYRLGDVLVSRLGKTCEITNTDAEGRLVLGDMLAWANEQKPACIIDLATLTGACIIALGNSIVGAFGDDDQLMFDVLESSRLAGEEMARLPLSDSLKEVLKSDIADMKNAGERAGGSITAALFLREFVGTTPWVHLDIAGPATISKEKGYHHKGATGVGVRTLVEFVRRRVSMFQAQASAAVNQQE